MPNPRTSEHWYWSIIRTSDGKLASSVYGDNNRKRFYAQGYGTRDLALEDARSTLLDGDGARFKIKIHHVTVIEECELVDI